MVQPHRSGAHPAPALIILLTLLLSTAPVAGSAADSEDTSHPSDPGTPPHDESPPTRSKAPGEHEVTLILGSEQPGNLSDATLFLGQPTGTESEIFRATPNGTILISTPVGGTRDGTILTPNHYEEQIELNLSQPTPSERIVTLEPFDASTVLKLFVGSSVTRSPDPLPFVTSTVTWDGMGNDREAGSRLQTGLDGIITVPLPGPGTVTISFVHEFHNPMKLTTEVNSSGAIWLTTSMTPAPGTRAFTGQVIDAHTGTPVEKAVVKVLMPLGLSGTPDWIATQAQTWTDETGNFTITYHGGSARLHVEQRGYFPETSSTLPRQNPGPQEFRVQPRPEPSAAISGRIIAEPEGTPVADATVRATTWIGTRADVKETQTGADGRFTLSTIEGPTKIYVGCEPPACNARGINSSRSLVAREEIQAGTTALDDLSLRADPLSDQYVQVEVTDPSGSPLEGAVGLLFDPLRERVIAHAFADAQGRLSIPRTTTDTPLLMVLGPTRVSTPLDILRPSGFEPVMRSAPLPVDGLEVRLARGVGLDTEMALDIQAESIELSMTTTPSQAHQRAWHLLLDTVFGDGDGHIEPPEVPRVSSRAASFNPVPPDALDIRLNDFPIRWEDRSSEVTLTRDGGDLSFIENARSNVPLGTMANITVGQGLPDFTSLHGVVTWPPSYVSLPERTSPANITVDGLDQRGTMTLLDLHLTAASQPTQAIPLLPGQPWVVWALSAIVVSVAGRTRQGRYP